MFWSEGTYSEDPVKRAAFLRIQEIDPAAMRRARSWEVKEAVERCKQAYDRAYEAMWEHGVPDEGLKSGAMGKYLRRTRRLEETCEEVGLAAALQTASSVRLTSGPDDPAPL